MPKACSDLCFYAANQVPYIFSIVLRINKMPSSLEVYRTWHYIMRQRITVIIIPRGYAQCRSKHEFYT